MSPFPRRIVFAWELGSNYGHVARLLPIALALRERGHEVVFVLRDLGCVEQLLTPHGLPAMQAPLAPGQPVGLPSAMSYAEILMAFGFLHPASLLAQCRAWRHLLNLLEPDLLVMEYAPGAMLAARGLGLPRFVLGSGFVMPPRTAGLMPPLNPAMPAARQRESEQRTLQVANAVLAAVGAPALTRLADLFDAEDHAILSLPELDHYPDRPAEEAAQRLACLADPGGGEPQSWPAVLGPRVFAYLNLRYPALEAALTALAGCGAPVLAHVPGASRRLRQQFSRESMRLSEAPLPIAQMREDCALAVCHGGSGTVESLLLAGKPLLLLPMHGEQALQSERAAQLGAARVLGADEVTALPQALPQALQQALADPAPALAAQAFATRYSGLDLPRIVADLADRCEALAASA